jgi:carbonic anhydrase
VLNLCQTTVVQAAWERSQDLTVHGWIYGLHDGILQDLETTISSPDEVEIQRRRA